MVHKIVIPIPDDVYFTIEAIAKITNTSPQQIILAAINSVVIQTINAAEYAKRGYPIGDEQ